MYKCVCIIITIIITITKTITITIIIILRFEGFEEFNFSKVAREDVRVKKSNCTTGIRTTNPGGAV